MMQIGIRKKYKKAIFWGFVLSPFLLLILKQFGLSLSYLQNILFPIFLLAYLIFSLSSKAFVTPNKNSLFALLGVWALVSIFKLDAFDKYVLGSKVQLSSFQAEEETEEVSKFLRIYKNYSYPRISLLNQLVKTKTEARNWLEANPTINILAYGKFSWLTLSFQKDRFKRLGVKKLAKAEKVLEKSQLDELKSYLTKEELKEVVPIYVPNLNSHFFLSKGPSEISLPTTSPRLSQQYLGLLAQSFESGAKSEDFLIKASELNGHWPSSVPRGYIRFLQGTKNLFNINQTTASLENAKCAELSLNKAAGMVRVQENAELRSAIFNNAAVSSILKAKDADNFTEAKILLWIASNMADSEGQYVFGAGAAYYNLILLERLGAVEW